MKITATLTALILCSTVLAAQTVISGKVVSDKGEAIPGANVFIQDAFDGATADATGSYSFETADSGKKTIRVSMLGFETATREVMLEGKPLKADFILKDKINDLNAVVISVGNYETGMLKKSAVLSSLDVATTAGATADVYGALKTLPGTQPASEGDGLFVRGGDAHETRTFYDGVLVNDPYTSQLPDIAERGRFSPFMFKGTSFSTGAYSAQYGQALSSTVSLDSKDVAPETKSDIGIMSVGLDASHVQRFKRSSLDLNASYYNLKPVYSVVKQNTQWTKEPESINTNLSYKANTGEKGLFKVYANYEHSTVGIINPDFRDVMKEVNYDVKSDNSYLNATFQNFLGEKWKIQAGAGHELSRDKIKMDGHDILQDNTSLHTRAAVTHYIGKASDLTAGVEYFHFSNQESFDTLYHELLSPLKAAYLEGNIFFTERLALRAGGRLEDAGIIGKSNLAPRAAIAFKLSEVSQVSAGYGRFFQLPEDELLFVTKSLDFEDATHFILNYQLQLDKRTFRAELYTKNYDKLVRLYSGSTVPADNDGNGYARGFDLFYRDTKTFRYADVWISYSFLDTKRKYAAYDEAVTPSFAARHVANVVGKYFVASWSTNFGLTYTYASGRTYFNPNNPKPMSDRARDYHNVSMNASYLTSIGGKFTIVYLSVENIFGIHNVYGYRYSPDGATRKEILPSAPRNVFLGIFITFGSDHYK